MIFKLQHPKVNSHPHLSLIKPRKYVNMRTTFTITFLIIMATSALAADPSAHAGLLNNKEMTLVNRNAAATQKLLFPEQQISACWPFDTGTKAPPLSGLAMCKVETAHMLNKGLHPLRGPDLTCSYLREEFCDIKPAK